MPRNSSTTIDSSSRPSRGRSRQKPARPGEESWWTSRRLWQRPPTAGTRFSEPPVWRADPRGLQTPAPPTPRVSARETARGDRDRPRRDRLAALHPGAVLRRRRRSTPNYEDTTITTYVADFDVADNGDLDVDRDDHRRLPGLRQARHLPVLGPSSTTTTPHARRDPEDISVTRDGERRAVRAEQRGPRPLPGGQDRRRPTRRSTLGEHIYVIKYHIDGVLAENDEDDHRRGRDTMFYWQLIPRGWQQSIGAVHAHRAPAGGGRGRRQVRDRQRVEHRLRGRGRRHHGPHRHHRRRSPTGTPVTDRHRPRHGDPGRRATRCPGPAASTACSAPTSPLLVIVLLLAARRAGVRRAPGRQVAREAAGLPGAVRPAGRDRARRRRSTSTARASTATTYVATLMHAAEKGAVDLTRDGRHLDHHRQERARRAGPGSTRSPPSIAHILGGPGASFTAQQEGRRGRASGCKDEIARFDSSVETWAKTSGQHGQQRARRPRRPAGPRRLRRRCWSCAIWNPFSMTMLGLIPGGVRGRRHLADGDRLRHQPHPRRPRPVVAGRRLPPDAVDAVEQGAVRLLRPQGALHGLHPVGGRARLRRRVGREVPHRDRRGAAGAALLRRRPTPASHAGDFVDSMVGDFGSTVDSAISSYNATQSSSSSGGGGGGFSGGGGGGGGGGGSW